jgi:hypothetical protein
MGKVTLVFEPERETKGAWRFAERLDGPLDEARVGSLYLRKAALRELGWEAGSNLVVALEVQG